MQTQRGLQETVALLLHRAEHSSHTMSIKVEFHVGIAGNQLADQSAGEATVSTECDRAVSLGNTGLKDILRATKLKTMQPATKKRPAVIWQAGSLSHDVKKIG